jgi:hypothetical protein
MSGGELTVGFQLARLEQIMGPDPGNRSTQAPAGCRCNHESWMG